MSSSPENTPRQELPRKTRREKNALERTRYPRYAMPVSVTLAAAALFCSVKAYESFQPIIARAEEAHSPEAPPLSLASHSAEPTPEASPSAYTPDAALLAAEKNNAKWQEYLAQYPIQPIEPSEPLHISLHQPAMTVDQIDPAYREAFPNGVPAVDIEADMGSTTGTPNGLISADGTPSVTVKPPFDAKVYYLEQLGTKVGVYSVDLKNSTNTNTTPPPAIGTLDSEAVEYRVDNSRIGAFGHASSVEGRVGSLQGLVNIIPGMTFTVTTAKGTITYQIAERAIPPKGADAINDPTYVSGAAGSFMLVACKEDFNAKRSVNTVALTGVIIATHPN